LVYLWFITCLCSLVLTGILVNKATKRFSWAYVAWIISFVLFTYSAFGSWLSYLVGWTPLLYQSWYFSAAILVAVMGLGQLLLLKWNKTAVLFAAYTALIAVLMLISLIPAAVDTQVLTQSGEIGGSGLPSDVRQFSPLLTIPGSLALIGGSLYSAIRFKSKAGMLICAGAIILASGGTFTRFEIHTILPIAKLVGILFIYIGANLGAVRKPVKSSSAVTT
jgi:hypothetical protein